MTDPAQDVVLATHGRFHTLDAARALHDRGRLQSVFTGYPRFKLKDYGIPDSKLVALPLTHVPYMTVSRWGRVGPRAMAVAAHLDRRRFSASVAARARPAKYFIGMSSSSLQAGESFRRLGAKFILDRGSTHIAFQSALLEEAYAKLGITHHPTPDFVLANELAEYDAADHILVPSTLCRETFLAKGVDPTKVSVLSYGVELNHFFPVGRPRDDTFDLLFVGTVSVRKQVHLAIDAFAQLKLPKSTFTVVGPHDATYMDYLRRTGRTSVPGVQFVGPEHGNALRTRMSTSHALVLPSVEEGLALVQAQAMACGCPVIASRATGGSNLFDSGIEGFIFSSTEQLAHQMETLARDRGLQRDLATAALARVKALGGWQHYGEALSKILETT